MKHDKDAEIAVIAAILYEYPVAMPLCIKRGMEAKWFYEPLHMQIYESLESMFKDGKVICIITVHEHMVSRGLDIDIAILEEMFRKNITVAHVGYYCDLVKKYYAKRQLENIIDGVKATIDEGEPAEHMDGIISSINTLSSTIEPVKYIDWQKVYAEARMKAKKQGCSGYPSRWDGINRLIGGYEAPNNIVIGARPSTGKTTFLSNELVHLAKNHGVPVAFASLDMSEGEVRFRMAGALAGVNTFKFRTSQWTDYEAELIDKEGWEVLNALPIYINDKKMNIDELSAWAISMKHRYNIGVLAVDFITAINDRSVDHKKNTVDKIGHYSSVIRGLGKQLNVITFVLSQFNRGDERNKEITPNIAGLEALRSSGDIEQNADIIILLNKTPGVSYELYTSAYQLWDIDLDIAKNRNGPTGVVDMALHTTRQEYITRESANYMRHTDGVK